MDKDHCEEEFDIQDIQIQNRSERNVKYKAVEVDELEMADSSKPFLEDMEPVQVESPGEPPGNQL